MRTSTLITLVALVAVTAAGLLVWKPWQGSRPVHAETASFGAVQRGVPLTAGLTSYLREAEAREKLPELETQLRILRPATAAHPPRDLVTLEMHPYEHLGVSGRLTLDFFNDRLMEATFYPDAPVAYADALPRAEPGLKRDQVGRREKVEGPRRVVSNVEQLTTPAGARLGGTAFTIWQDRRLRAELDDWDQRFGHLPAPATPR